MECFEIDRNLLAQAIDGPEALNASPVRRACDEVFPSRIEVGGSEP